MLSKSIKLNKQDNIGLADIVKNDPRVERGPSEALRICFEDAASNIPDWDEVMKKADDELEYPENDTLEGNDTKTFLVDEDIYSKVFESVCQQLNCTRPRASFITRLCIFNTRLKLHAQTAQIVDTRESDNDKREELIERFRTLTIDEKLEEIYKRLLGGRYEF